MTLTSIIQQTNHGAKTNMESYLFIALKTHPNHFRSGNQLTVSVWKQDQEFTFLIHNRVLSLKISEKKLLKNYNKSIMEPKPLWNRI